MVCISYLDGLHFVSRWFAFRISMVCISSFGDTQCRNAEGKIVSRYAAVNRWQSLFILVYSSLRLRLLLRTRARLSWSSS
jgi:hypothetical protein